MSSHGAIFKAKCWTLDNFNNEEEEELEKIKQNAIR